MPRPRYRSFPRRPWSSWPGRWLPSSVPGRRPSEPSPAVPTPGRWPRRCCGSGFPPRGGRGRRSSPPPSASCAGSAPSPLPSPARAAASVAWIAMLIGAVAPRPWRSDVGRLVALWAVPHLAHIFLAHDVAYPRYMLAPAALLAMAAGLAVAGARRGALVGLAVAIACVAPASARIAGLQARQPPVEYQAARYLARQPRPLFTILSATDMLAIYLADFAEGLVSVKVDPDRIADLRRAEAAAGHRVYSTEVPADEPSAWVPVAHFCQDPMIEPL